MLIIKMLKIKNDQYKKDVHFAEKNAECVILYKYWVLSVILTKK